jgi:hypothetical protein
VDCIYCRAPVGHQRSIYPPRTRHLCTFFDEYWAAPTKAACDRILERDHIRRNHGCRERPPKPEPTPAPEPETIEDRPYPPWRPGELEEIRRRRAQREAVAAARERNRPRNAFARPAQPYKAEPYRPWREMRRRKEKEREIRMSSKSWAGVLYG